jgi:hypothetical protein
MAQKESSDLAFIGFASMLMGRGVFYLREALIKLSNFHWGSVYFAESSGGLGA